MKGIVIDPKLKESLIQEALDSYQCPRDRSRYYAQIRTDSILRMEEQMQEWEAERMPSLNQDIVTPEPVLPYNLKDIDNNGYVKIHKLEGQVKEVYNALQGVYKKMVALELGLGNPKPTEVEQTSVAIKATKDLLEKGRKLTVKE